MKWAIEDAPRNGAGIVYHLTDQTESWVDYFYKLPPFLARAGYFDEALRQIDGYWTALIDADKNLLSHRWHDGGQRFIRKVVWGVGNGWAAAGMARVITMLPEKYAEQRERLIERVRTLQDAALPMQREDGIFHDVLDDKSTFPEINFGQKMACAIYCGVKASWMRSIFLMQKRFLRRLFVRWMRTAL